MKSLISGFLFVLLTLTVFAQDAERSSINNGGGHTILDNLQFSYSIGQPVIGYASTNSINLSQGFQQAKQIELPPGVDPFTILYFKIYPNPAVNFFNIKFEFITGGSVTAQLFDATGRLVRQFEIHYYIGPVTYTIPIQGLSRGVYTILLRHNKNGKIVSEKIIFH